MLVIVFGLVASAITAAPRALSGVDPFLAWALAIIFVAFLCLLLSSTFFGWPDDGAKFMARQLGAPQILTQSLSSAETVVVSPGLSKHVSELPGNVRAEPADREPAKRIQEIARLPKLDIQGILEVAAGEKRYISASSLHLDGSIVTNGGELTIEVNDLVADDGRIRASARPPGNDPALAGRSGGRVVLIVHNSIAGAMSVDLRGEASATGSDGTQGGKGQNGAAGNNAASSLFDCRRGAGRGGPGGMGSPGTDGSTGGTGGDGGTLVVYAADVEAARRVIGSPELSPGSGGTGGALGKEGPGGDGGAPRGLCSGGGPRGEAGPNGPDGLPGAKGTEGAPGTISYQPLSIY